MNECTYCSKDNDGESDGVTCDGCGWWACDVCAEDNGWDAEDKDGKQWCGECL